MQLCAQLQPQTSNMLAMNTLSIVVRALQDHAEVAKMQQWTWWVVISSDVHVRIPDARQAASWVGGCANSYLVPDPLAAALAWRSIKAAGFCTLRGAFEVRQMTSL